MRSLCACMCSYRREMLIRCGGNVIEVGRRQIAVVATAALVLLMVSLYSVSLLHGVRRARDADWIQPTPIEHVLGRGARGHRLDNVEHTDDLDSLKHKDETRRKPSRNTGGLSI